MSDGLTLNGIGKSRALRQDERAILIALLHRFGSPQFLGDTLSTVQVADLSDGGMGSIRFLRQGLRVYDQTLIEAWFLDDDGVPVSLSLNADQCGDLFELDIWKVDFAPLCRYPLPVELSSKEPDFKTPRLQTSQP